ncbi:glutathione S-transferase C-terminal domain-containing protein [Dongia sedimenti]|uniref:Glutathione S-transferase C-terminal domain-containing protein n=1 Tax=Dongia sedimenti TaxID=3064282 RepID=A0ABU0YPZ6_9PROT|nr:glutathione S-transferase C-terminal domain-containing protein [Rhodospirillaceae bacterium R-7]
MKLYMHSAACSLSPHIVCRELGLDIELIAVDRATHRTADGRDYLAINGNGYVPLLELEDGTRLMEGPAIVQFLADLKPEAGLAPPAGTLDRARLQAWLNFVSTELHKPMAMQFYPEYAASREGLRAHVVKRLAWLSQQLAGDYLLGDRFSAADAYLFVCLNWTQFLKLDLAPWPNILALMRRVAARPAVRAAIVAEGLVPTDADGAYFTVKAAL